ncbi:hypothetical protein FIBSPDRAFT_872010 [Athelia psychrophila]|uniref:Uncharacterized protein n=1 Tax=Athelia psychrophila TaxID=1759441 RepID=A0A165ZVY5_9AGAM|nr:hypothetical protein FIBSPDRAFT_872010 [Fibularhizoctonia sp. CBS 109695]
MAFGSTLRKIVNCFKKKAPSPATELIPSVSQTYVLDMQTAFRQSAECHVECDVSGDKFSGTFRHSSDIDQPQVSFVAAVSRPGPALESASSWISDIWRHSASFDTVSIYSQLSSPLTSASLCAFDEYPSYSLAVSVSSDTTFEDAIEYTNTITASASSPPASTIQVHARDAAEAMKKIESTATASDPVITISTSVSFRLWQRAMLADMAMARLGDDPNAVPSDTPARFKGVDRPRPAQAPKAPRQAIVALSTSESENRWLGAEGAPVAHARLGDEPNAERADMPLRFPSAHPTLVACRKTIEDHITQTHKEASMLEEYAEKLKLSRARNNVYQQTDISAALFAALAEVQEHADTDSELAILDEHFEPSDEPQACESVATEEPAMPLQKPKKQVRFADTLEQVRFIDARIIVPSANKYALRKTIVRPAVHRAPVAGPAKVPRAGGISGPIDQTTRIPQRAPGKENIATTKIAASKGTVMAQRRPAPSVLNNKMTPTKPTKPSPFKITAPAPKSAPAQRPSPPSTPPSKGARNAIPASRGRFLP